MGGGRQKYNGRFASSALHSRLSLLKLIFSIQMTSFYRFKMSEEEIVTASSHYTYLRIADELTVQVGIKSLNMATVHVQHGLPDNADLQHTRTGLLILHT